MPINSKITGAPFRFWCQKVLPAVYDDSLSYYELLCKVVDYLNKVMEDDINVVNLVNELEEFVNNYFDNLDVQQEINNKLDAMAEDGSLLTVVAPHLDEIIGEYEATLDADLAEYKETIDADIEDFKSTVNTAITAQDTDISNFKNTVNSQVSAQNTEISSFKNSINASVAGQDNDISVMQSQMSNFIDSYSDIQTFTDLYTATATNGLHYISQVIDLSHPYTDYPELDIYWSYNSDKKVIRVKSADLLADGAYLSWYVDKSPDTGIPAPMYIALMKLANGNAAHTQLTLAEAYSEEWDGLASSDATRDKSTTASEYTAGEVYKIVGVTYTTSAELTDIRVGYDGTIYDTAGDSVRDQVSDIHDIIDEITDIVHSKNVMNPQTVIREQGIYSSTGKLYENSTQFTSDFIPVSPGDIIRYYRLTSNGVFYNTTGTNMAVIAEYADADEDTWISCALWQNDYEVQSGHYIRFSNPLTQIDTDRIVAVTINNIFTANTIEPYYVNTFPIDNPHVTKNNEDIEDLQDITETLDYYSANGVSRYYAPFFKYPLLSGVRTDFYCENVLYGCYKRMLGVDCGFPGTSIHRDSISIEPSDGDSIASLTNVFVGNTKLPTTYNVNIPIQKVNSNTGSGNKKVLIIGDSMTANGTYQNYVNEYFENDAVNIEWLGTRTSQYGLKHEGRSGWRAYTYTHFRETTPSDGEGEAASNPFYNPVTNEFDFTYYMNHNAYTGVDIVFINLGTNDFARGNHNSVEDVTEYWNDIVSSIHEYSASIKVVLWLCPMPCVMLGTPTEVYKTYLMHKVITDNYMSNNWGNNNNWILPSYLALDPVYGFEMHTVQRNQYDTTEIVEPLDTVHPSDNGYHQLSNPIIAMIKYLASI